MFSSYSSAYPQRPSHYYDYPARDYVRALAQQQERERQEAQYNAQLEEARRRRTYQEQLARAEATRRRNSPFVTGFDDGPYSGFFRPIARQSSRPVSHVDPSREDESPHVRRESSEDLLDRQTARDIAKARQRERRASVERSDLPRPSSRSSTVSPKPKVVVEQATPPPSSPSPDARDTAARTIQSFVRAQLPRLSAFKAITNISQQFEDAKTNFQFPSTLDFAESSTDGDAVPALVFTPTNAPLHGHEHALVKLLSDLDAVDSHGDARIRRARKELVRHVESALSALDAKTLDVWKCLIREREARAQTQTQDSSDDVKAETSEVHEEECAADVSANVEGIDAEEVCVADMLMNQPEADVATEEKCVPDLVVKG